MKAMNLAAVSSSSFLQIVGLKSTIGRILVQVSREECTIALIILVEWLAHCALQLPRSRIDSVSEFSRGFIWDIEQAVKMAASLKRQMDEQEYLSCMRTSIGEPLRRLGNADVDAGVDSPRRLDVPFTL